MLEGTAGAGEWAAGFEMGRLDQQLAALVLRDRPVGLTIRSVNREEAARAAERAAMEATPTHQMKGLLA